MPRKIEANAVSLSHLSPKCSMTWYVRFFGVWWDNFLCSQMLGWHTERGAGQEFYIGFILSALYWLWVSLFWTLTPVMHRSMCTYKWCDSSVTSCPLRAVCSGEDSVSGPSRLGWGLQANQPSWGKKGIVGWWTSSPASWSTHGAIPQFYTTHFSTVVRKRPFWSVHLHLSRSIILTRPSSYTSLTATPRSLLGPGTVFLKAQGCSWNM